jgi:hypothetical protein
VAKDEIVEPQHRPHVIFVNERQHGASALFTLSLRSDCIACLCSSAPEKEKAEQSKADTSHDPDAVDLVGVGAAFLDDILRSHCGKKITGDRSDPSDH